MPDATHLRRTVSAHGRTRPRLGLALLLVACAALLAPAVVVDEGIEGKVTIELANTPARKALDAVCERIGWKWEIVESTTGAVLHVSADR